MTYAVVLPFVHAPYARACLKTCKLKNLLVVDNTERNRGVMRSHNMGIDHMRRTDAEWLIVVSAAIRFGEPGGLDFAGQLQGHVIEAAGVYGWHLIAFHRETLEKVGRWDENFYPYGFDDIDLSIRIQKAFQVDGRQTQLWDKVEVDAADMGMAHSIKLAGVEAPPDPLIAYFERKWGRHPGAYQDETFDRPFNNPHNPIGYWPDIHGARWDQ